MTNIELIDKLNSEKSLSEAEFTQLFATYTAADRQYAADIAREIAVKNFGNRIFFRGIVEFTNICKNDCLYCGLRCSNKNAQRYRLDKETMLDCCEAGHELGFRTFVLQGGEDMYFTDGRMCDIVASIRARFPDCAITLSIGERSRESYQKLYDAGANRFLLRHESATAEHYAKLHPAAQTLENRIRCLNDLREIGYQVGCGCMIGTPYQTPGDLARDMVFMHDFKPHMIGIGPFVPHHDTPFRDQPAGSVDTTLLMLSLCRIMIPRILLPATTALGTVNGSGRKLGVLAGANVIMPNLSPKNVRKKYMLYDNKAVSGEDAAESLNILKRHMNEIGYEIVVGRGDFTPEGEEEK